MVICYSGKSAPSARKIADEDSSIELHRGNRGDVNWGRSTADTALNPDIGNVTNKRRMRQLFKEHDVPMPDLLDYEEAESLISLGGTVVGRPDKHTKGRGFWKCSTQRELDRAVRGTRKKKAATHFMEYIDGDREYRVHVFMGKSIRISEKIFEELPDGTINKGCYYTGKPQHNVKHVRKAAKKALEAVGLDFGAVDILADDDDCWVLEVNAAPGLGGTMPKLYAETFKNWFEEEA